MKARGIVILAACVLKLTASVAAAPAVQTTSQALSSSAEEGGWSSLPSSDGEEEARLAESYVRKARSAKGRKHYDKAKIFLMRAIELDDKNERAWTDLAWVCNEQQDYDEGAAAALGALLLNEKNAEAWREAGYALHKKGQNRRAVEALTAAIKFNPRDPDNYRYRASALEALGKDDAAERDRETADELGRD
jgi:tetratricopeptide (TPR) repeat protein